jgi:hypothetical protein
LPSICFGKVSRYGLLNSHNPWPNARIGGVKIFEGLGLEPHVGDNVTTEGYSGWTLLVSPPSESAPREPFWPSGAHFCPQHTLIFPGSRADLSWGIDF